MVTETSLMAYFEVLATLGEKQQKVFNVITNSDGLTNMEIADILGWSINRVTGRTNELVKMYLVKEKEKRKCRVTGRLASAWE